MIEFLLTESIEGEALHLKATSLLFLLHTENSFLYVWRHKLCLLFPLLVAQEL
jgi:hypothetical protein